MLYEALATQTILVSMINLLGFLGFVGLPDLSGKIWFQECVFSESNKAKNFFFFFFFGAKMHLCKYPSVAMICLRSCRHGNL